MFFCLGIFCLLFYFSWSSSSCLGIIVCFLSFRRRVTMVMVLLGGVCTVFKRAMGLSALCLSCFILQPIASFIEMYLLLVRLLLVAVLVALSVVFFGWTLGVLYVILDVLFF